MGLLRDDTELEFMLRYCMQLTDLLNGKEEDVKAQAQALAPASGTQITDEERDLIDRLTKRSRSVGAYGARIMGLRYTYMSRRARDVNMATRARLAHDMFRIDLARVAVGGSGNADNKPPHENFLSSHMAELQQCAFWTAQPNRADAIVQTMNKALPQRCQTRDGGETTLSKYTTNDAFAKTYTSWLDCSLLGMYSHASVPLTTRRIVEFAEIMSCAKRRRTFYMWLLQRQDLLCIFVSREYLLYVLPQQPSLLSVVKKNFCWERFTQLCVAAMGGVRNLVNRHGWAVLFVGDHVPSVLPPPVPISSLTARKRKRPGVAGGDVSESARKLADEANASFRALCAEWLEGGCPGDPTTSSSCSSSVASVTSGKPHTALLNLLADLERIWPTINHRQLPRRFGSMLAYVKERVGELAMGGNSSSASAAVSTDASTSNSAPAKKRKSGRQPTEDLIVLLQQQAGFTGLFYDRKQNSFWQQVFSARGKAPPNSVDHVPEGVREEDMMSKGITRAHHEQLESWIARCSDYDDNKAVRMLLAFGMPQAILTQILMVKRLYDSRQYGRKQVSTELLQWKVGNEYAHALLHNFANLWIRHTSMRVYNLPMHWLVSQIAAIRGRFNLRPHDPLPDTATRLTVCTVCRSVFTLHNTRVKKLKPSEAFGFQKVTVDIGSNTMYCSRTSVADHVDFKHCPLRYIPVLGRILEFAGKLWTLCPQPMCGQPFVLNPDPAVSMYNEHGFGCQWCTAKVRDPENFDNPRSKSIVKQTSKTQQQRAAVKAKAAKIKAATKAASVKSASAQRRMRRGGVRT